MRLTRPDGGCGFKPVHDGHLHVHQYDVRPPAFEDLVERLSSVRRHTDAVSARDEHTLRNPLIHGIVFDQQH